MRLPVSDAVFSITANTGIDTRPKDGIYGNVGARFNALTFKQEV
jgi:hypothetical protein